MNVIPIFPELVDNSMRKELVKCQTAAKYRYEMNLRSVKMKRVDLHAGKAFAKGMEVLRRAYYIESATEIEAVAAGVKALYESYGDFACPKDSNKSADRMAGALAFYVERRPLAEDNFQPLKLGDKWGFELPFSFDSAVLHPVTGVPIKYGGRLDFLALNKDDGKVWFVDEKTGSQLGDKWANQWQMDSQTTGYYKGVRHLLDQAGLTELEVGGGYINGIAIKKYDYDHVRVGVHRADWEVERWWIQANSDLARWVHAHVHGSHDMALDHACAYYNNPCDFQLLCKSRNPERVMDGNFEVEVWNPIEGTESKMKGE